MPTTRARTSPCTQSFSASTTAASTPGYRRDHHVSTLVAGGRWPDIRPEHQIAADTSMVTDTSVATYAGHSPSGRWPFRKQRTVNPLMAPACYNFPYSPQGRPCGRPPPAAVLAPAARRQPPRNRPHPTGKAGDGRTARQRLSSCIVCLPNAGHSGHKPRLTIAYVSRTPRGPTREAILPTLAADLTRDRASGTGSPGYAHRSSAARASGTASPPWAVRMIALSML
jgi:hypothetical protein